MDSSVLGENDPNGVLMVLAFMPMFGNISFQIDDPGPQGEDISNVFPTIPYLSVEAILYQQMISNPLSAPYTTYAGSNTGQQVISGQYTMQDQNGTNRYQQGFQSTT